MRTLLLVGVAALVAVCADPAFAHGSQTVERRVTVIHPNSPEDVAVYSSNADRAPTEGDYRGRWQGQWNGTWEDADGRRYRGTYEGQYDAHGDRHAPPPPAYDPYDDPACRDGGNTAAGAAVGGIVGGVAGNRIAGRGHRTVGTVVGAAAGAAVGGAIANASTRNRCERHEGRYRSHGEYGHGGYDRAYAYDGYGYEGGQVIVIPGQPVIVEETETTYETVVQSRPTVRRARVAPRGWGGVPRPSGARGRRGAPHRRR